MQQEAIVVRNAKKRYANGPMIFDGLNMVVSRGTIYGLLGASGCGKTTLLSCVVGVRKLDSGEIWVLGGQPGTKSSSIPGPRVGYMPQEISLVQEFSAIGALYYFGRINGLEDDVIEAKFLFLSELLQLPPKNRLIKHMSGGQQRRVSFACALLHEPELLVVDEPTVGLDPLLREGIWKFLVNIARVNGTTIVITTHYIDEAKEADKIGLLRNGKLLAEASPSKLLARCNCDTLEEAFLQLSQKQNDAPAHVSSIVDTELEEIQNDRNSEQNRNLSTTNGPQKFENTYNKPTTRLNNRKFKALMIKNFIQFIRHPGGILFAFIFPLIQVNIFFNAIGGDPRDLKMAVVNEEAGDCYGGHYDGKIIYNSTDEHCEWIDLSCRFLNGFEELKVANNKFYDDQRSASDAVREGKAVGSMYFSKNFTKVLQNRRDNIVDDNELPYGQIDVSLDMGDRQIGLFLEKKLYESFFEIFEESLNQCNLSKKLANTGLAFEAIYGTMDQKYTSFVAPTFMLTLTFFLATSVSSAVIISDRHEGVWDRSLVQGVTTAEILTAHVITQLVVIIIQVSVTLMITFLQYDLECKGSMTVVIFMVLCSGICGMSYGFLISVICTSHTFANYITTGSFYPVILLCGCIWPIEGMPRILRWLSMLLPQTVPGTALRNILGKGYALDDVQVYQGFLIIGGWITALLFLCFLSLRKQSS